MYHETDKMITEGPLAMQQMVQYEGQVNKLSRTGCEGSRPEIALVRNTQVIEVKGAVQRVDVGNYTGQQE